MATALFTNQTANGVSPEQDYTSEMTVSVQGVFDGALVFIEISNDAGTTWQPRISFNSPQTYPIKLNGTWKIRARLTNAGSSTSVSVSFDA